RRVPVVDRGDGRDAVDARDDRRICDVRVGLAITVETLLDADAPVFESGVRCDQVRVARPVEPVVLARTPAQIQVPGLVHDLEVRALLVLVPRNLRGRSS